MFTQFFGSYLINKNIITSEQLLFALEKQASARPRFGALAIHAGYMTASEVDQIFILQTHQDKRFGELAVEQGYLTQEQVNELLSQQIPEYILLGQILVDEGFLTTVELQNHITDYRSEYEIFDLDMNFEQKELVQHLLQDIDFSNSDINEEFIVDYVTLLFNNLIRFIGDDFTPLNIIQMNEVPTTLCIVQDMDCPVFRISSAIDMDTNAAITFASRYAKDEFHEFDEYVRASMADFLNLHNGLFLVNMSNNYSIEVSLMPPQNADNTMFAPGRTTYLFPIMYPFGIIHFICSIYEPVEE